MIFSPKLRFLANKELARKHRELMASPDFQAAAEAALQHFSDLETRTSSKAEASFHRIAASREFLGVLLNLGDASMVPVTKPEKTELNYRT